jgi:hypothetical protein
MDAQSAAKLPFNLKIIPTSREGIPMGVPFLAMLNPESFAIREAVTWFDTPVPGKAGADPTYLGVRPRTFTIDFTLDGTGVNTNGVKIPVTAQVALFRGVTTNVRGAIHRPSYLMVQYGTFVNVCVLNTSTVTYTMFDLAGLPIRAKVSATFTERIIPGLSDVLGMLSSPDLTHRIAVKEYDLLPLLTYNIYKDQHYYLQVAKTNRIKNFRKLKPGTELNFYPIGKKKKQ